MEPLEERLLLSIAMPDSAVGGLLGASVPRSPGDSVEHSPVVFIRDNFEYANLDRESSPSLPSLEGQAREPVQLETSGLVNIRKMIVAGDPAGGPPDSPGDRVDANTADSPFAGIGSLAVTYAPDLYIGTAAAISPTHVLTAAHMIDLDDDGTIDVAPADVEFNLNFGSDLSHVIPASDLFIHPDWTGFGNPSVNDDVAVIELSSPLPTGVPIYSLNTDPFESVDMATFVGYGQSGDGISGYYVDPAFNVKRTGGNLMDFFGLDDEGSGAREIFEFDFDGNGWNLGSGPGLGNDLETTLGGGDSGGPAFIDDGSGGLEIFGINTYTFSLDGFPEAPLFGSGGGGIVIAEYADWISSITGVVEAPPTEFTEDFESGDFGQGWSTYSSSSGGRIEVTDARGAAEGSSFALLMDTTQRRTYNLNEAIWTADLSGFTQPVLSFWCAEWGDETHRLPDTFTGHANGDGVAISQDGTNWRTVLNAPNQNRGVWEKHTVDLSGYGSNFQIKFQQYDNFPLTSDGRGWDQITITDAGGGAAGAAYDGDDDGDDETEKPAASAANVPMTLAAGGQSALAQDPRGSLPESEQSAELLGSAVDIFAIGGTEAAPGSDTAERLQMSQVRLQIADLISGSTRPYDESPAAGDLPDGTDVLSLCAGKPLNELFSDLSGEAMLQRMDR